MTDICWRQKTEDWEEDLGCRGQVQPSIQSKGKACTSSSWSWGCSLAWEQGQGRCFQKEAWKHDEDLEQTQESSSDLERFKAEPPGGVSQIDSLNANKVKYEKDNHLCEARLDLEDAVKGKAELHKQGKLVQAASNTRLDEMARALNEAESTKKRPQVENQDLNGQIEELENDIANITRQRSSSGPSWSIPRLLLMPRPRAVVPSWPSVRWDRENLRDNLQNEVMRKSDAIKTLSKFQAEI